MKSFVGLLRIFLILGFYCLVFTQNAYAYLDLGTGSYILQLLLGILLGGLFAIKLFWSRIKTFFKNLFSPKKKSRIVEKYP